MDAVGPHVDNFAGLPAELLPGVLIASSPPAEPWGRARLRAVCRAWRRALDAPAAWADLGLHPRAYFSRACSRGDLEAARWLADVFRLPAAAAAGAGGAEYTHEPVARWLASRYGAEAADAAGASAWYIMEKVCAGGDLACAQWAFTVFRAQLLAARPASPGTQELDSLDLLGAALRAACRGGHEKVARWLVDTFGASAAEVLRWGAFEGACWGGRLDIARWLVATFGITAPDARAAGWRPLHAACAGGHLGTARWLAKTFRPSPDDVRSDHCCALRMACAGGHLATAQWLAGKFRLTTADARSHNCAALRLACTSGHTGVARWLVDTFAFVIGDLDAALAASHAAPKEGLAGAMSVDCAQELAQWAQDTFGTSGVRAVAPLLLPIVCQPGAERLTHWFYAVRRGEGRRCAPSLSGLVPRFGHGGGLQYAARHGNYELVRRLVAGGTVRADADLWPALRGACAGGHLRVAEFLAERHTRAVRGACLENPARASGTLATRHAEIIRDACVRGWLTVAQWAVGFDPQSRGHLDAAEVLKGACLAGRLLEARWLADTFGLSAADAEGDETMRAALDARHLAVAQWLASSGPGGR